MKMKQREPGVSDENQNEAPEPATEAPPSAQTENPAQPGLKLPDDAVNLVPFLLEAAIDDKKVADFIHKDLPDQIVKHFNEDWESSSGWRAKRKERVRLRNGDIDPKKEPFKNCANIHAPILMTRELRLVARVWSEIWTTGLPLFSARPSSTLTEEKADLITKHENWQFSKEIPEFPTHTWRALMEFFDAGECVFESYRDFAKGVNRHEFVSPDEFVYPYVRRPTAPDMSDVPRKTKMFFMYKRDLLDMEDQGFYAQIQAVVKKDGSHETDVEEIVRDAVDAFQGKDRKDSVSDAPYYLLEQHTWVQIPYQDREEPVRVVMDGQSRKILALYSRYYDDPEDRVRFERETQEHQQYMADISGYMQVVQREQELLGILQSPEVHPEEAQAIAQQVQVERPAAPQRPPWMQIDEVTGMPNPPMPCKKKVIERFSRATCVDTPEGALGLGQLMMAHQMAANIMLNQFIDAGTLANSNTVACHDNVKFPPGTTTINPNEIIKIRGVPPADMEKAFFKFDHPPANPQLLHGVQVQESAADSISSAPDVLSGEKEGDETFRGMATRVEQATKQLSALAAKFMMVMTQVAKNNALLNFMFLPDSKKIEAPDPMTGKPVQITVGRELYRDSYDIIFSADLSFASRASKVAESDDALGLLLKALPPQILTLVMKPEGVVAVVRKCLQARGMNDIAAYLNNNQELAMKMAQGMAGGPQPGGQPGMPPPAIPNGQPQLPPGGPPQHRIPEGTPPAAAPNVQ